VSVSTDLTHKMQSTFKHRSKLFGNQMRLESASVLAAMNLQAKLKQNDGYQRQLFGGSYLLRFHCSSVVAIFRKHILHF